MNSKLTKIVLVEDDIELASMIKSFLEDEGFDLIHLANGMEAEARINNENPDLVILDIMLPGVDGIEVCRRVRKNFQNPILIYTAKGNDLTEVSALKTGADAYLNKPIRPHILLAHIDALLRRNQMSSKPINSHEVKVQDLIINFHSFKLFKGTVEIILTGGEFELLSILAKNLGKPVNRNSLTQLIKHREYDGLDRSIDLRISSIRKKLDDDIPPYCYIKTIRSKGYVLVTN